jgi:hypothetical protein
MYMQEELNRAILLHKTDMATITDRRQDSLLVLKESHYTNNVFGFPIFPNSSRHCDIDVV